MDADARLCVNPLPARCGSGRAFGTKVVTEEMATDLLTHYCKVGARPPRGRHLVTATILTGADSVWPTVSTATQTLTRGGDGAGAA